MFKGFVNLAPVKNVAHSPATFFSINHTSYVIPHSGWYRVCAVGGGGSGAGARHASAGNATGGGGGGGYVEGVFYFDAGITIRMSIGAGGASTGHPGSNSIIQGNPGADTVVVGGSMSMRAFGGGGGVGVSGSGTGTGGAGGREGIGGQLAWPGGNGGDAVFVSSVSKAAGGGAPGTGLGRGGNGGTITSGGQSTGGGGCGGYRGGNATGGGVGQTGGGGTGGDGVDNTAGGGTNGGANMLGVVSIASAASIAGTSSADGERRGILSTSIRDFGFDSLWSPFYALTGGSGYGTSAAGPGSGAGCQGVQNNSAIQCLIGGGGGAAGVATPNSPGVIIGGGSGGAAGTTGGNAAKGGDGLVTIERVG